MPLLRESDLHPDDRISFGRIRQDVEEFEQVLNRHGIEISPRTPLESICLDLLALEREAPYDTMEDLRVPYRAAFGAHDLFRRIVRLQHKASFPALVDHLRLLNGGTVAQNVRAPTDAVAAKIFELLMGLICLEIGDDVALDGPVQNYGDNPDILVNLDGERWGFACKVLGGASPITMFDRLEEGVNQIQRSEADIGCVVFNLKNQIDHDATWPLLNPAQYAAGVDTPIYGYASSLDYALGILRDMARVRQSELLEVNDPSNVRALFAGRKAIPGALLFLQTTTGLQLDTGPANTVLGLFQLMDFGVPAAVVDHIERLNDAMHHTAARLT